MCINTDSGRKHVFFFFTLNSEFRKERGVQDQFEICTNLTKHDSWNTTMSSYVSVAPTGLLKLCMSSGLFPADEVH